MPAKLHSLTGCSPPGVQSIPNRRQTAAWGPLSSVTFYFPVPACSSITRGREWQSLPPGVLWDWMRSRK